MIHCVNLNSTADAFYHLDSFVADGVNRATRVDRYPGGKGANVARVVATLGGQSRLVALTAQAGLAQTRRFFTDRGVKAELIPVPGENRLCMILQDKSTGREMVVNAPTAIHPNLIHLRKLIKTLVAKVKPGDYVTLSGSAPEGLSPDCFAMLIRAVRKQGGFCLQDSYGPGLKRGVEAAPFLVKVNDDEIRESFGWKARSDSELLAAMDKIIKKGVVTVIVTLGKRGALVRAGDGAWKIEALKPTKKAVSPVGCGDSFLGGIVWGMDRGLRVADSLRLATAAAWDNLHHPGACFLDEKMIASKAGSVRMKRLKL